MDDRVGDRSPNDRPLLSLVVPVFNEEEVIRLTHERILDVLGACEEFDLEIVYVDDGSTDRGAALLRDIAQSEPRVCMVSLSRNFGHQPAVTAGLRHASGDMVAIIDADLQDPIELIPEMIAKWREGYSVAYGVRRTRQEAVHKVIAYRLFYRMLAWTSDIDMPTDSGDFCLLDRTAVDAINRLPEKNRFVRGLRAWCGGRQIGIPYDRPPRAAGTSGYPFTKLLNLAFDGIVSFSLVPLRFIFWLGLGSFLLAMLALLFVLVHRIFAFQIFGHSPADVPGLTSLMLVILLMGGVQLLSIGVLGEYLGRIYLEVKNRPEYLVAGLRPSLYAQPAADMARRPLAKFGS